MKKMRHWRPGTVALREIRHFQKTTHFLIKRAPFARLVRETVASVTASKLRIGSSALQAIQEATEAYMISLLSDTNMCALHARRVTAMPRDMQLAKKLRGERF
jgi:histone H3/H4